MQLRLSILLTLLLSVLGPAGLTLADGCKNILGKKLCGRVVNKTRWGGRYGIFGGGGLKHKCFVYNWNGGDGSVDWNESSPPINCNQTDLAAGESRGGWNDNKLDVDGITFHDRRWRIIWEHGQSFDFREGVWAKISTGETITCTENREVPECRVSCAFSEFGLIDSAQAYLACIGGILRP